MESILKMLPRDNARLDIFPGEIDCFGRNLRKVSPFKKLKEKASNPIRSSFNLLTGKRGKHEPEATFLDLTKEPSRRGFELDVKSSPKDTGIHVDFQGICHIRLLNPALGRSDYPPHSGYNKCFALKFR
jgi:hypothetical protein